MGMLSNYLENKLIDQLFRGQAYSFPATLYVALLTEEDGDAGGGTEVSGGSYARVAIACTLANWAGTQGAGTTTASNGASGTTSNNGAITFPEPTANWGVVAGFAIYDAPTAGNLLIFGKLLAPKTINSGDAAPVFLPEQLSLQLDN